MIYQPKKWWFSITLLDCQVRYLILSFPSLWISQYPVEIHENRVAFLEASSSRAWQHMALANLPIFCNARPLEA